MTLFEFYDRFRLEIRGDATVIDYLLKTFEHFAIPDHEVEPDLVVSVATEQPDPETVLGGSDVYFGIDDGRFVIQEGKPYYFLIDQDWGHIRTSPENIHHHVAFLIEFEIRKRLAKEGKAIAHAAGVKTGEETLLFPAWRSAGKTNAMLSLVKTGANYLADDRVWVDDEGSVEEYPIPINILHRNDEMLGYSPDLTRVQRIRMELSDFIKGKVDRRRSILDKMAYVFSDQVIALDKRYRLLSIDELIPGAEHGAKSTIDRLIFLRSQLNSPGNVTVEPITESDAISALRMISYWEWNRRLHDYFGSFDLLFPEANRLSELQALLKSEAQIFASFVGNADLYRARIPREKDWIGTGIATQIREKLPSQATPTE